MYFWPERLIYVDFQFFTYNFLPNLSTLILTPKICISQFVKKTDAVTFLFEKHLIVTFLFEKHLPVTFLFKKHLTVTFLFCNLNLKQKFAPTYENSNVPPPPIVVSKPEKKKTHLSPLFSVFESVCTSDRVFSLIENVCSTFLCMKHLKLT